MKSLKAAAVCLVLFSETVFSQDSTSVSLDSLPQAPLPQDSLSLPKDSLPQDTLTRDTALVDSTKADSTTTDTTKTDTVEIKKGLRVFASVGVQLINFKERLKFQDFLNEELLNYKADYYLDSATHKYVLPQKQDFQTVNLAFPLTAGIMWQFNKIHAIGLGAGFLYDKESVTLKDKYSDFINYSYTLQAFPAFVEYRLGISPNLISMRKVEFFSVLLRYYWMLSGTKVTSDWGNARADFEPLGNGFGISLAYCFSRWGGFEIWGEMGYLSIDVKSNDENDILNSWNLGGMSVMIRAVF